MKNSQKEKKEWKIVAQKILNVPKIIPLKEISHPGTGNINVFIAGGRRYLIKKYPEEKYGAREALNLSNIQNSNISAPKYFGYYDGFFVEEYKEGKLFQDIINNKEKGINELYTQAVRELIKIHSSGGILKDKRKLKKNFEIKSLQKRIRLFFYFIENFGLPSFEKFAENPKKDWFRALKKISVPRLIGANGVFGKEHVIGHGDYKPNNIIITESGLCVIDWLSMAKAQPWYDLAYLFIDLKNLKEKERFIRLYLDEMSVHTNVRVPSVSNAMVMFREGRIYQELQRAKSNSRRIKSERDTHHIEEFRRAMDGIASIVL